MYRTLVLALALLASATAFAPMSAAPRSASALSAAAKSAAMPFLPQPANLDGSLVGDVGFDPLGFSDFVPMAYLREAELKHGRICMMAVTGYVALPGLGLLASGAAGYSTPSRAAAVAASGTPKPPSLGLLRAPFSPHTTRSHSPLALPHTRYISVDLGMRNPFAWLDGVDVTSATAHDAAVASGAMTQLGIWIGLFEMVSWISVQEMLAGSDRAPGDFGFDPLRFLDASEEAKAEMALKEITHCRLAMLGFSGIITQSVGINDHFPYFPTEFLDQSTMVNHF